MLADWQPAVGLAVWLAVLVWLVFGKPHRTPTTSVVFTALMVVWIVVDWPSSNNLAAGMGCGLWLAVILDRWILPRWRRTDASS